MSPPKITTLICALTLTLLLAACGVSGNDGSQDTDDSSGSQVGVVQKGPFRSGGDAKATELETDGSYGDASVSGSIVENGAFELPPIDWRGPTEILLTGTFFDEFSGEFSGESRELRVVLDVADTQVEANVNLYTHLAAARTLQLMADGNEFADASQQASGELQTLTGISAEAHELDLLDPDAETEEDGANLLLFSAAVQAAGQNQADIDAMAADFADDGLMNGSASAGSDGEAAWEAVRTEAADTNLLDTARANLEQHYDVTPPQGSADDYGWELEACEAAKLNEPRVVCENDSFRGNHRDDSGEFVVFIPQESGHYTVELFGDPAVQDDNTGACLWTIYTEADTNSTDVGDSRYDGSFCGVEDVSKHRLTGGERYYILPSVSQDDTNGPDASFVLRAVRVSEGKATAEQALELELGAEPYEATIGTLISTSDRSYYRFEAGSGNHTISAYSYPCSDGELRLLLYEDSAFSSRIAQAWEAGCSQTIQISLDPGKTYYLMVENRLGSWHRVNSRPAPGQVDFTLDISND